MARAGDAPPDVTQLALTRPLEAALATVLGVERIRSKPIRPAGTSLGDTDAVARKIEALLVATPEVRTYSRRTGAELGPAAASPR